MILYYIFVLSLPFVDHPWFGIGFGGITVEKVVGAAAILYSIVHLARRDRKPVFVDTWPARAFLLFFLVTLFSYLMFGRQVTTDQISTFHPFNFLLMFFMTISVVDSLPRLRWTLLAAVGSLAWASLYMLREWQVARATYGSGYRPGFVVGDPNYFAASALLCLPLAFYFARSSTWRWMRWYCAAAVLLILAGITVSASRGGLLGLIVIVPFMIWHSKRRVLTFILVLALVGAFLVFMPTSGLDRLRQTRTGDGAEEVRITLWKAAWKMFRDNPITGVGYTRFRDYAPRYLDRDVGTGYLVHNQYLELLAEMGLPGLLAYLGVLVGTWVALGRMRRDARHAGAAFLVDAASGIQIGLIGYAVAVFFLSANFLRLSWFMVAVTASMQVLVADAVAAKRRRRIPIALDRSPAAGAPAQVAEGL
jgi:probable O-glycosylation ligase (exosortase A-associated)